MCIYIYIYMLEMGPWLPQAPRGARCGALLRHPERGRPGGAERRGHGHGLVRCLGFRAP